jgi:hypothetical protein
MRQVGRLKQGMCPPGYFRLSSLADAGRSCRANEMSGILWLLAARSQIFITLCCIHLQVR